MDSFRTACLAAGLRLTLQRMAVYDALAACKDHPDAETLHGRICGRFPMLSLNTVYRTLGAFVEHGLATRVASISNSARFDANTAPHDHFLCAVCSKVLDLPEARASAHDAPSNVTALGQVQHVQTVYIGTCHSCGKSRAT